MWRDTLDDANAARLDELELSRQRKRIRKVELANLIAQGIDKSDAHRRAYAESAAAIEHSMAIRQSAREFTMANAERRRAFRQSISAARAGSSRKKFLSRLMLVAG